MFPDDWCSFSLGEAERKGIVSLGRGDVISRIYLADHPGPHPVYSSSAKGDGMFGSCSTHMFDEELITWSIDGGGRFFYRPRHRFSVTNVCGYMRVLTPDLDARFLHASLDFQHQRINFDYQSKAHPSVIRPLYRVPLPPLPEQKKIAAILSSVDEAIQAKRAVIEQTRRVKEGLLQDLLTRGIGHTRFKQTEIGEIPDAWKVRHLRQITQSRDSQRIPLKAADRKQRPGTYRYFGASGVIDSIDDFIFDGPNLLVAEDGFNLLRRATPIAFVVDGRYWVNNHAHVLGAQTGTDLHYLAALFAHMDIAHT